MDIEFLFLLCELRQLIDGRSQFLTDVASSLGSSLTSELFEFFSPLTEGGIDVGARLVEARECIFLENFVCVRSEV
jgi:hypothetical protein